MSKSTIHPIETLKKAFDKVKDPRDWKAPINAVVKSEDIGAVWEAVVFYTATQPEIIAQDYILENSGEFKIYCYRVKSEGYRNGPAGP